MGADWEIGSGFLIEASGQIYLVTTAHIANYQLEQRAEWSEWSPDLFLIDDNKNASASAPLFDETNGVKTPLFKYLRATDDPDRILDLILLPLSPGTAMAKMSRIFVLPSEKAKSVKDDKVLMFGRRDPWPHLNVTTHRVAVPDPAIMHMEPEGTKGDSGAPVLTTAGSLVGMNFGHDNPQIPGAMVISSEIIEVASTAMDGFVNGWTYTQPVAQAQIQP